MFTRYVNNGTHMKIKMLCKSGRATLYIIVTHSAVDTEDSAFND